jgi:HSP20 family protein
MFARTIWVELNDFRRSFDQVFDNFSTFSPAVETGWTDDHLNLRVILPGVTQKDLKVSVQANQLLIEGERKAPENFGKEGNVYQQIAYGKFQRVLDLPNGLDTERLQAHLYDGVLDIRIPMAQAVKPKQIPISTGETSKSIAA